MGFRIVVGADSAGHEYKEQLRRALLEDHRVEAVHDVGVRDGASPTAYPSVAIEAATRIATGAADRALLVCGTGLGVAIAANKVEGVRAVTAHDVYSVRRSILSNDAQVLCLGQRVIGLELARALVDEWLAHVFDPSSASAAKVAQITDYETSC